jgi:alpha,alpha-trehalase
MKAKGRGQRADENKFLNLNMKKIVLGIIYTVSTAVIVAQNPTPDKLYGPLFKEIQLKRVFADNKTFVDCTPKYAPETILKKYNEQKLKPEFDLKEFVNLNFNPPQSPVVHVTPGLSLRDHLEELWNTAGWFRLDKRRVSGLL